MSYNSHQILPHLNLMSKQHEPNFMTCTPSPRNPNSLFLQHLHKKIMDAGQHIYDEVQTLSLQSSPASKHSIDVIATQAMDLVRLGENLYYMDEFSKHRSPLLASQPFNLMEILQDSLENLNGVFQKAKCEVLLTPCSTMYCLGDPEVVGSIFEILLTAFASDTTTPSVLHITLLPREDARSKVVHYKLVFTKPHSPTLIQRLAVPLSAQFQMLKNLVSCMGGLLYPASTHEVVLECILEATATPESMHFLESRQMESGEKVGGCIGSLHGSACETDGSKEGNTFMQQQIRHVFKQQNYVDLWFASDNADALFHYREMRMQKDYFDLIFLDNEFLTLTHRDVCSQIRKEDRVQVILSFCPPKAQPENSKALGYDDCINKPLSQEELKDTLSLWLKLGHQRRLKYFQYKLAQAKPEGKACTKEGVGSGLGK